MRRCFVRAGWIWADVDTLRFVGLCLHSVGSCCLSGVLYEGWVLRRVYLKKCGNVESCQAVLSLLPLTKIIADVFCNSWMRAHGPATT